MLIGAVVGAAVATVLLRLIHREIGIDHDLLAGQPIAIAEARDADARGDPPCLAVQCRRCLTANQLQQVLGDDRGAFAALRGEQGGELIPAEPDERIGLTQARLENLADPHNQFVARAVAWVSL